MVFVHAATTAAAYRAITASGLRVVGEFHSIGVPVAIGTTDQVRALAHQPSITYVEHSRPVEYFLDTSLSAIRADDATELATSPEGPFDGSGNSIAVIDTGVDGSHPMFMLADGTSKVVRNLVVEVGPDGSGGGTGNAPFVVDVTNAGNNTDIAGGEFAGHGTHVAGIAAGVEVTTSDVPPRTFSGVARGASIVALSMGYAASYAEGNAALDWIARHHEDPCGGRSCPPITVVNNSYGGAGEWDPESATSKLQKVLTDAGVTIVWSNGNAGDEADSLSNVEAQAPYPGVIAVALYEDFDSGTRDGTVPSASSRGRLGDMTTYPDVSAPGGSITSACRPTLAACVAFRQSGSGPLVGRNDLNYATFGGSSMSAPHVAGAVAALQHAATHAYGKPLRPGGIEELLEDTAHKFTFGAAYEPFPDDPANPGGMTSLDKGHGLIDLTRALETLLGLTPSGPTLTGTCAAGAPLASDPEGDATGAAFVDAGDLVYEPSLDVTSVAVAGDSQAQLLVVTIKVADLGEGPPPGATSIGFNSTLGTSAGNFALGAVRDSAGERFTVDGETYGGTFDAVADTVTWQIPRAVLDGGSGLLEVKSLTSGFSRRMYSPAKAGLIADWFRGGCPTTVDIGE